MSTKNPHTHIFGSLVRGLGGVEPSAATLEARHGSGNKGTVSKMCHGHMAVTVDAFVALEDAAGVFPLTQLLFSRISAERLEKAECVKTLGADANIECAEAMSAIFRGYSALSSDPSRLTPEEISLAIAEVIEAIDALNRVLISLQMEAVS